MVASAAGPPWLLVVNGEVVQRGVGRAGVHGEVRVGPGYRVAMVTAAHSQVARQMDLQLEPHLSVLEEPRVGQVCYSFWTRTDQDLITFLI